MTVRGGRGWAAAKRVARPAAGTLVVFAVVDHILLPQIAGARKSVHLLAGVAPRWLAAAAVLEVLSLLAYSRLTTVCVRWSGLRYLTALRIDLSTLALANVVPAGSAVGLGVGYVQLTRHGVPSERAVSGKAVQAAGSAVVLNLMFGVAVVFALVLHGADPLYGPIAGAALLLLLLAAGLVTAVLRGQQRIADLLVRLLARLPRVDPEAGRRLVDSIADTLRAFGSDRRFLLRFTAWAVVNWLLDAGTLWCAVWAFGHSLGPVGLLVAYCIANVAAALPLTPGGLGVVEGVLVPVLVAFDTTRGVAVLGVLAWRLFQFWLPIPIGLSCYASLVAGRPRSDQSRSERSRTKR